MLLASFLFDITLNALAFMSFFFSETHIFGDKKLQFTLNLSKTNHK